MLSSELLENLDGMFPDDLRAYARKLKRRKIKDENDITTQLLLVVYAREKAKAMEARSTGKNVAFVHEHNCEAIYQSLPSYAKW